MSNNLDNWLSKQQVAQLLCVAEKTVDRMAASGEIQKAMRKRPGLPPQAVFHPDDVERAQTDRQKPIPPFVMPSRTDGGQVVDISPGHVSDLSKRQVSDMSIEPLALALNAIADRMPSPLLPSELAHKLWLTEDEAAAYSGLGKGYLRKRLAPQPIGARGAMVYRRKDLEAL